MLIISFVHFGTTLEYLCTPVPSASLEIIACSTRKVLGRFIEKPFARDYIDFAYIDVGEGDEVVGCTSHLTATVLPWKFRRATSPSFRSNSGPRLTKSKHKYEQHTKFFLQPADGPVLHPVSWLFVEQILNTTGKDARPLRHSRICCLNTPARPGAPVHRHIHLDELTCCHGSNSS
jgi:hypothetical protein